MTDLSFAIPSETHETIAVEDMGEGALILIGTNEDGTAIHLPISFDQLHAACDALAPRYADAPTIALAA